MTQTFGTQPKDLLAAVGPCIGPCCFETDQDVPDAMTAALGAQAAPFMQRRGVKWHVDLAGLNRQWLLRAGVLPDHVETCGLCTACHPDLFWSHRKMGQARGSQIAMAALPLPEEHLHEKTCSGRPAAVSLFFDAQRLLAGGSLGTGEPHALQPFEEEA